MNYFETDLDFCLTQPHNTFPDLHSYWLCGKVDQGSGKLIPKTLRQEEGEGEGGLATAKKAWGLSVSADSHADTHVLLQ